MIILTILSWFQGFAATSTTSQVLVSSTVKVMIFTKVEQSLTRFLQAWRPSQPSSQGQSTPEDWNFAGREGFLVLEGLDDWFRRLRS